MFLGISSGKGILASLGLTFAGIIFVLGVVTGHQWGARSGAASSFVSAAGEVRPDLHAREPAAPPSPTDPVGAFARQTYVAEVLRVIDGDTFEARVAVWPGLAITTKVRLRSIDAPELKARCAQERDMALAARDLLEAMLAEGTVGIARVKPDKYGGRIDADVFTRTPSDVSHMLLEAGLARRYNGGRRLSWCDDAPAKEARVRQSGFRSR